MFVSTFLVIAISFCLYSSLKTQDIPWTSTHPHAVDSLRDSTRARLNQKSGASKTKLAGKEKQPASNGERVILTGPKGGRYYINEVGKKVYVKDSTKSTVAETDTSGRTIYTGPRGGKYYFNEKGEKVYLKRKIQTP